MAKPATILLSKTDFAAWLGVGQSAVSNYIALGQISPGSIVGEGRHAKIAVNLAIADLRERLDATGSQALNTRAILQFYPARSGATELDAELERILLAEIESGL